jgi:DNA-binding winged helix-turn-helix (wHTH) protein
MRFGFGSLTLDLATRQLTREGVEIHLTPKAFALLRTLVEERPTVLSKAALLEGLWPETFVAEANLSNLVSELRRALGDRARDPKWIRTAHGFGYAFCGKVTTLGGPDRAALRRPGCWIEWGQRRFLLTVGEHVIGRDPSADVRLEASTVSRHHAKIVVTADSAVLEDFGSKNGTRRRDEPVTSPIRLVDGDAIHVGSVLLTFRVRTSPTATETHAAITP